MGVVFLAHEVQLDRLVAIKLLPPELAAQPAIRDRFLNEARLAARLSHPHVIPVHAVEDTGRFVFFVMAYVDGETLTQRVARRGPLTSGDAMRTLREITWALAHAHAQGLVHRDVKPDNVLIETGTGRALVADFGIAAIADGSSAAVSGGTPEFMSPEQALGISPAAPSDLYSFGVTAYFALTGDVPYRGASALDTLRLHAAAPPPRLVDTRVAVSQRLASLVERCLQKDPAARPSSAQHIADALDVALAERRELPAMLRAFVKRDGRMNGGGTLVALAGSLGASIGVASVAGDVAGVATLCAGAVLAPIVFAVAAARRLAAQGFTRQDLAPAFAAERETGREERGATRGRSGWWTARAASALRALAAVAFTATVATTALAAVSVGTPRASLLGALALFAGTMAAVATLAQLGLRAVSRDVDLEFWEAVWNGGVGSVAFRFARMTQRVGVPKLLGGSDSRPPSGAGSHAMTHRATELSLGLAAEELFETLPRSERKLLGDLPSVLRKLQRDAETLRARRYSLQTALQNVRPASHAALYDATRTEHDRIAERLQSTIAAMESIRLGLLRLHAGALDAAGLTTHVALAEAMSENVDRLIAANAEVEALLNETRDDDLEMANAR